MKYIFVAGAPGSKWSSLCKNIYYSPDVDRSDYTDARTYYHDASGRLELMHLGAYYDPGMEFGDFFRELDQYPKDQCEAEFDRPFSGTGIRIVKSHVFAHHIDYLKDRWPDCPIVLALRPNDACLGWWVRCGEFGITYPSYHGYYSNLRRMAWCINRQNADIKTAWDKYNGTEITGNLELCDALGLAYPPEEYRQDYLVSDLKVKVI